MMQISIFILAFNMIDIALSLCMYHQIYDYVCIFVWGGEGGEGGAYGLHFARPLLGLSLNMCTLSTNINVMHGLKVIHTLLATCSYIEPFN